MPTLQDIADAVRVTLLMLALIPFSSANGQVTAERAAAYFDFSEGMVDLTNPEHSLQGMELGDADALVFDRAGQTAKTDVRHLSAIAEQLDGAEAMTIGGWFFCVRWGEQAIVSRGLPKFPGSGDRMFRRSERYVKLALGTDHRGFFYGTINGNGKMPFMHVTANRVPIDHWSQLVVVKTADGYHRFYRNGKLIHSDRKLRSSPGEYPYRETVAAGDSPPLRLRMPMGGRIGEAWILPTALTEEEIHGDFEAKAARYQPAHPGSPVALREMDSRPDPTHWDRTITRESWPARRRRIRQEALEMMGRFPDEKVALRPKLLGEEDMGAYLRRKVSIAVQPGDRMPAYLLIPKGLEEPIPAVVCFYGTTAGAGKKRTVGISGASPGSEPHPNSSFAADMVKAGFAALAPDYLRDGERLPPSERPYDTTAFYERFPEWSTVGKDVWDTMRAIDYLETLDFVDAARLGMVGHSYGGHSTLFAAAFDPRIKAAVANGPVSAFREHGMHWAVSKGAAHSQSLPRMRKYLLAPGRKLPITFYEWTALIAPRPLLVGQAVGERRPIEEENYAAVARVYDALGHRDRVRYLWYPGDHDFPPAMRSKATAWLRQWLEAPKRR